MTSDTEKTKRIKAMKMAQDYLLAHLANTGVSIDNPRTFPEDLISPIVYLATYCINIIVDGAELYDPDINAEIAYSAFCSCLRDQLKMDK